MDAGLLDVLHERADVRVLTVRERVDVDLDRVLEEAVDERAPVDVRVERVDDLLGRVADAHRPAAEHVRRPHEHGIADAMRERVGLGRRLGDPPLRAADAERVDERAEALAVLGEIDRLEGRPEHAEAGLLDRARKLERRLAAELDHDADRLLALEHREHLLDPERLEVEPVRRVVVGGDRLRVAVDHHGLVAELAEARDGVDAAVVELDALSDPVRAGAEDHDRAAGLGRLLVDLVPGGVEVVALRIDLGGDGVDAAVDGLAALRPDLLLAHAPGLGDLGVREPEALQQARGRGSSPAPPRIRSISPRNQGWIPSGRSSQARQGVVAPASSSRERNALR